jgi:hypothetical protein
MMMTTTLMKNSPKFIGTFPGNWIGRRMQRDLRLGEDGEELLIVNGLKVLSIDVSGRNTLQAAGPLKIIHPYTFREPAGAVRNASESSTSACLMRISMARTF